MAVPTSTTLLKMENIPNKGRGLIAAQDLKAGQIILTESPLLLYSASPLFTPSPSPYCHHCFRTLQPSQIFPCPSCSNYNFCGQKCLSIALNSSHSSWSCQILSHLQNHTSPLSEKPYELQVQARFIVAAYNLDIHTPSNLQALLSLHSIPNDDESDAIFGAAKFIHSLISPFCPPHMNFSPELAAKLIAKERLNSFCLMEPYSQKGPQRSIKAYGIYQKATLFNHGCIPNACRFDYVENGEPGDEHNTDIVIRLINDVDVGSEICISYFRINKDYSTRKRILMEDYGFACECDRCKIEANWNDGENNHSDLPHVNFLSKFVCDKVNCAGTLAPLPPKDGEKSNVLECNFCGNLKVDTTT
ncbi:histone-lysine N-methyltransferase ASHR2-like [Vicia villosa]|uniref:histone-lysine N-methyltransferase ASHR2-like n=1 Tax=Vicia villosa TaxID=3911 RepID=UPI00273B6DA2|nr:histone-lysine N-methyltransferase ASHR2-like [Vicia villosa]